jgi:hypothetical protein
MARIHGTSHTSSLDLELSDGIDRISLLKMIEHAVWKLFGYPREAVPIVQYEYTNWSAPDDPYTTRSQVFKVLF